jgi:hypothetical protein
VADNLADNVEEAAVAVSAVVHGEVVHGAVVDFVADLAEAVEVATLALLSSCRTSLFHNRHKR